LLEEVFERARAQERGEAQGARKPLHDRCPFDPRPDGPRERQMGNAVTVPVAEWIGRRIVLYEQESSLK
jgi:site-specific DNA-cytosine methylase